MRGVVQPLSIMSKDLSIAYKCSMCSFKLSSSPDEKAAIRRRVRRAKKASPRLLSTTCGFIQTLCFTSGGIPNLRAG